MEEKTTINGECLTEFEKWYLQKYHLIVGENIFNNLPPSMKYSVLVDYFDSIEIYIDTKFVEFDNDIWFCSLINRDYINSDNGLPINHFKTRHEAREKAINKANLIRNKRLQDE